MRLVFYGGGHESENIELHKESIILTEKIAPTIAYIPAQSYGAEEDFREFVRCFKKLGVTQFLFCPVDLMMSDVLKEEILSCDLIHLGGGNTYYFIHYLRKQKLMSGLKAFAKRGGVLTGLSAGGIMMTPKITSASYPKFDCDINDEGVTNYNALNLVKFEFFPHYKNSKRYNDVLAKESRKLKYPLFACPDHSGLVYNEGHFKSIERVYAFIKGDRVKI